MSIVPKPGSHVVKTFFTIKAMMGQISNVFDEMKNVFWPGIEGKIQSFESVSQKH
jgi:preprotein translocase subunit SecE